MKVRRLAGSQAPALIVIHKCRQAGKRRHIGMDADIQAIDGNHPTVQVLDSGELPTRSFPSVDSRASVVSHSFGWFPSSSLGTLAYQAPACSLTVPREARASKTAFPNWSLGTS